MGTPVIEDVALSPSLTRLRAILEDKGLSCRGMFCLASPTGKCLDVVVSGKEVSLAIDADGLIVATGTVPGFESEPSGNSHWKFRLKQ